ncbi:unnamed protein product [Moneuplotes crassus]|uniref:Uncharacterized protein n=1 Tax=Euplotes crassus TaxID=5936 RepID=A0AAD1UFI0_EUPCR|nr:unnamed protein product [Moneuplotes crassus]
MESKTSQKKRSNRRIDFTMPDEEFLRRHHADESQWQKYNFNERAKDNTSVWTNSQLNQFSMHPEEGLQEKLDYFITPYNTSLIYKKFMEFDEEEKHRKMIRVAKRNVSEEWQLISDFILNLRPDVFKKSCESINKGLFLELKQSLYHMLILKNKKRKSLKGLSASRRKPITNMGFSTNTDLELLKHRTAQRSGNFKKSLNKLPFGLEKSGDDVSKRVKESQDLKNMLSIMNNSNRKNKRAHKKNRSLIAEMLAKHSSKLIKKNGRSKSMVKGYIQSSIDKSEESPKRFQNNPNLAQTFDYRNDSTENMGPGFMSSSLGIQKYRLKSLKLQSLGLAEKYKKDNLENPKTDLSSEKEKTMKSVMEESFSLKPMNTFVAPKAKSFLSSRGDSPCGSRNFPDPSPIIKKVIIKPRAVSKNYETTTYWNGKASNLSPIKKYCPRKGVYSEKKIKRKKMNRTFTRISYKKNNLDAQIQSFI